MAKYRITIMIDGKTLREIDRWAKLTKRSRSDMIGNALHEWLENARLGKAVLASPAALEGLVKVFQDRQVLRTLAAAFGEEMSEKDFQEFEGLFAQLKPPGKKGDK